AKAEVYKMGVENKLKGEKTINVFGIPYKVKINTEVILDFTQSTENDGAIGYLIFDDRKSEKNIKVTGENKGIINNFRTYIGITMDKEIVSDFDIMVTAEHEAGHSAGLNHPWELSSVEKKLVPELDQERIMKNFESVLKKDRSKEVNQRYQFQINLIKK